MTKIWGVRASLIGDTIMALPILTYLKKKYPDSHITWAIHKKCAQAASLYLNHPLIDRIKITDEWNDLGLEDKRIMDSCDVVLNVNNPQHPIPNWFNYCDCIIETARMVGIFDLTDVLSADELYPKLYKWFASPSSLSTPNNNAYTFNENKVTNRVTTIAIWPFANYMLKPHRSPTQQWWEVFVELAISHGYRIDHFGYITEPKLSRDDSLYRTWTQFPFDEQIKMSLDSNVAIGTDSGSMWVLGAYSHPAIHLMTFHETNHYKNESALTPYNINGTMFFNEKNINLIRQREVLSKAMEVVHNA